ncbi:MAG: FadR/GntR family transcriptional regulator [Eubacteriales bacterium]|nr:FadR/GntR family transcriptional regulator [Eubacteriales bacterium]
MYQRIQKNTKTLGNQTEDRLMEYILNTPVEIGERLPNEFELSELFHVGRGTIREAVKGLVARGVLEVRRGAGTYVVSTSSYLEEISVSFGTVKNKYQFALQLIDIRLMIEPEIAALACKNATEKDLRDLERLCRETETLYVNRTEHIKKDMEFHTCIAHASKNMVAEQMLPVLIRQYIPVADVFYQTLKAGTIKTHKEIAEAILRRDETGARYAMMIHLTMNRAQIQNILNSRQGSSPRKE